MCGGRRKKRGKFSGFWATHQKTCPAFVQALRLLSDFKLQCRQNINRNIDHSSYMVTMCSSFSLPKCFCGIPRTDVQQKSQQVRYVHGWHISFPCRKPHTGHPGFCFSLKTYESFSPDSWLTKSSHSHLKTVDTIGNCQRPVFLLGISQHIHEITNL